MRAITASLVLLVGTTHAASPARAKCAYSPVAERLADAEVVFQGRLVGVKRIRIDREIVDDYQGKGRESSAWLGEFRVEKVWKGSVGSTVTVVTEPVGCGNPFKGAWQSSVMAAHLVGPYLVAHSCMGIPASDQREALNLLGVPNTQYSSDATMDLASYPDVENSSSPPSFVAAGFLAGTAVASLIFAWTTYCRSRRHRRPDQMSRDG